MMGTTGAFFVLTPLEYPLHRGLSLRRAQGDSGAVSGTAGSCQLLTPAPAHATANYFAQNIVRIDA